MTAAKVIAIHGRPLARAYLGAAGRVVIAAAARTPEQIRPVRALPARGDLTGLYGEPFAWGRACPGADVLALSILCWELAPDEMRPLALHRRFARDWLEGLAPDEPWVVTARDVREWCAAQAREGGPGVADPVLYNACPGEAPPDWVRLESVAVVRARAGRDGIVLVPEGGAAPAYAVIGIGEGGRSTPLTVVGDAVLAEAIRLRFVRAIESAG